MTWKKLILPVYTMEKETKQDINLLVRIMSTDIPGDKQILYSLAKIKGIGVSFAHAVLNVAKIDQTKKTGLLTQQEIAAIEKVLTNPEESKLPTWLYNRSLDYETGESKHLLNADLDFAKQNDVKRMMKLKSYKGLRHSWRLPLRGQRTKSNFRRSKTKSASAAKRGKGGKK